jgi:hypothetical protein
LRVGKKYLVRGFWEWEEEDKKNEWDEKMKKLRE